MNTDNNHTDSTAAEPPDQLTAEAAKSLRSTNPAPASTTGTAEPDPLDGVGLDHASRRGPKELRETVLWSDGRTPDPSRICTAHRTNGEPCRKTAIRGSNGCATHGGSANQVRRNARARLENAADRMARQLLRMAEDDNVSDSVKLAAIRDALDRSGLGAKTALDVNIGPQQPWEELFENLAGGSRADSRAARGIADDARAVLEAEVVGDSGFDAERDGLGRSTGAGVLNHAPQQRHSPGPDGNAGNVAVAGGGTGPAQPRQHRTNEMAASPVDANYPPIVSLDEAHPDDADPGDEPRRNPKKRNRAITPKHKRERF